MVCGREALPLGEAAEPLGAAPGLCPVPRRARRPALHPLRLGRALQLLLRLQRLLYPLGLQRAGLPLLLLPPVHHLYRGQARGLQPHPGGGLGQRRNNARRGQKRPRDLRDERGLLRPLGGAGLHLHGGERSPRELPRAGDRSPRRHGPGGGAGLRRRHRQHGVRHPHGDADPGPLQDHHLRLPGGEPEPEQPLPGLRRGGLRDSFPPPGLRLVL